MRGRVGGIGAAVDQRLILIGACECQAGQKSACIWNNPSQHCVISIACVICIRLLCCHLHCINAAYVFSGLFLGPFVAFIYRTVEAGK